MLQDKLNKTFRLHKKKETTWMSYIFIGFSYIFFKTPFQLIEIYYFI